MLMQPTLEQLYAMRLNGMAEAFRRQLEDPAASELAFEERFALLVESQWTWKESRALTRRLQLAKLKQQACLEDIDFRHPRGLEQARWMSLAHESAWVRRKQNVVLVGPTGVGKSFLACALAHRACRDGFSALYTRAPQLLRELHAARAEGSLARLLAKLAKIDALVVDDFALAPMSEAERRDFLDICDDRYRLRSTILTSQLPADRWHGPIGDPTVADSILDRMVHHAHRFELQGESLRKVRGQAELTAATEGPS
ncbi:MAG: IS21-like element helper ATPase IstB [Gammaproteobacteria bacterium]|nr:IS21-like element helper ATPase IstB [Gammaproteobacteria bacterium]